MSEIVLDSEQKRRYCSTMLSELNIDGSQTVVFKKTSKDSTAKQRRLQWMWYGEVANSGIGRYDTKEGVHIWSKFKFAHPILMRDDEVYPILYDTFKKAIETSENYALYIKDFASQYISTERLSKRQRAEYLTEFQRYWIIKGVNLTDPALQGVDLSIYGQKNEQ